MKPTTLLKSAALFSLVFTPTIFFIIIHLTGMKWLWWVMALCLAVDTLTFYLVLPMAAASQNGFQISLADAVRMRMWRVPYEKIFQAMGILRDAGMQVAPDQLIAAARKGLDPMQVAEEYLRQN